MQEKTAEELIRADGHRPLLAAMSVILISKRDPAIFEVDQAMVGDGNAMRVTSKILQNVLWAAERPLGVDDPVFSEKLSQELAELPRVSQAPESAVEAKLFRLEQALQTVNELASEYFAEDADWQSSRQRHSG